MDPNASELCWRGGVGTLWSFPMVEKFWIQVMDILQKLINAHILQHPDLCILGNILENIQSRTTQRIVVLAFLSTNWKTRNPDCFNIHM